MKISRFRVAAASLVVIVGVAVVGIVAATKPEAAGPLIWALVAMGLARVGAAAMKIRRQDQAGRSPAGADIGVTHGEIA